MNVSRVIIPLTQKSVNIELDYNEINNKSSLVSEDSIHIGNIIGIVVSVILTALSIMCMIKCMRLLRLLVVKKSKYDKYISKILKEYDRLIVECKTVINFDNYEIIKVNSFEELLDVRDNLKMPINYYIVAPHNKAYFYILSTNVYLYVLKAVDLENN